MESITVEEYTGEVDAQLTRLVAGVSSITATAGAITVLNLRLQAGLTRHLPGRDGEPMCGADAEDAAMADMGQGPEQFDCEYSFGQGQFCTPCVWQLLAHGPEGPDPCQTEYDEDTQLYAATSPELPGREYRGGNRAQVIERLRKEEVLAVMSAGQRHGI